MVSVLDSGSNGPGLSPSRGTALCSWARHFNLIIPLSTHVCNLLLGVTLQWTSVPSRGNEMLRLVASCYGNRDKLWPDGPLGLYVLWFKFFFGLKFFKPV